MIDYKLLGEAVEFYQHMEFERIEAPWLVSKGISDITKPEEASSYLVRKDNEKKEKVFVASGEQSFLYLINKGFLPSGSYQTVTPCMRSDDFGPFHTKYFVKLELIKFSTYYEMNSLELDDMVKIAFDFFKQKAIDESLVKIVRTGDHSYDIEYNGIEIGSYGIRETSFCSWVYGTGLAEPRFSRATQVLL